MSSESAAAAARLLGLATMIEKPLVFWIVNEQIKLPVQHATTFYATGIQASSEFHLENRKLNETVIALRGSHPYPRTSTIRQAAPPRGQGLVSMV